MWRKFPTSRVKGGGGGENCTRQLVGYFCQSALVVRHRQNNCGKDTPSTEAPHCIGTASHRVVLWSTKGAFYRQNCVVFDQSNVKIEGISFHKALLRTMVLGNQWITKLLVAF